jgi:predicted CoA-substrate-specific enzyme activase
MKLFAGIDIGSLSTETVMIDDQGNLVHYNIILTGASAIKAAKASFSKALETMSAKPEDIVFTVGTGYGRNRCEQADATVTEITCHAKGAATIFPEAHTIIDIGGQDSKAIRIEQGGAVADFVMNDKCAAGTGRFLEVMARTLEIDLDQMGPISLQSNAETRVSSMCTVFAESEVVSLISEGAEVADIARGIHRAISDRTVSLAERVGVKPQVVMTGGVAKNVGVVDAIEKKIGRKLLIPEEPQIIGALGAAHIARQKSAKG